MRRSIVVGLIGALLLAGCGSLPMHGDVSIEEPRYQQDPLVDVIVPEPADGLEPRELVRDFLFAAQFGSDEFDSARKFLTPHASENWDPTAQVYIYSAREEPAILQDDGDGHISVAFEPVGMIDPDGVYVPLINATRTVEFSLVAGGNEQWRIAALDDGVMISDLTFLQTYVAAPLQFISADGDTLVPDLRWFPQSHAAEHVVEALLNGPTEWLEGGVTSAFRPGTEIGDNGVQVDGAGAVTVDLTEQVHAMRPQEMALMAAQLYQSLSALAEVSVVNVTVDGEPPEGSEPMRDFTVPQTLNHVYMIQRTDNALVRWMNFELEIVNDTEEFRVSEPRTPAVPYAESSAPIVYVAFGNELRTVGSETVQAVTLHVGEDLIAPSYDKWDWVWTASANPDGTLVSVSTTGEERFIEVPWLHDAEIVALRIAPGGDRIAVISRRGEEDTLSVAVVRRNLAGAPVSIGEELKIAPSLTEIHDLTWLGQTSLGVLGVSARAVSSNTYLHIVAVGGPSRQQEFLNAPDSLTSGRTERTITVVNEEGILFQRTGSGWLPTGVGDVRDPANSG